MQKDVKALFDERKANEVSYKRKFIAYRKAYHEFVYTSPSVTIKDSFVGLDVDQFKPTQVEKWLKYN